MRWFGLAALAAIAAPVAQAQTAEQSVAIAEASRVGVALYEHDRSAWLATDAMLAEVRNPERLGLRGWITEQTAAGVVTVFVREEDERLFAAYRGVYRDGALVESGRVDDPLTEAQAQLFRARHVVSEQFQLERCSERYNTVTLSRSTPGPNGEDVDVYVMPALTETNTAHFGGYHRVGVDLDTMSLGETKRYTNACLTLPTQFSARAEERMLYMTQMIGDLPTEVHVFNSLTHRVKVLVSAPSGLWLVDGATINPFDAADITPGRSRT